MADAPLADDSVDVAFAPYRSSRLRHPKNGLLVLERSDADRLLPAFDETSVRANDADLTDQHDERPIGQVIRVSGRVMERSGRPLPGALTEIWQANASGRYRHPRDGWHGSLDPNFSGAGRCVTDAEGRFSFTTIRPGAYPWHNHHNAWRPAHIHFSLFGRTFASRLITQMYFPDDPLLEDDPILQALRDPRDRDRLISTFDWDTTEPESALGFAWDIVLDGSAATPFEDELT